MIHRHLIGALASTVFGALAATAQAAPVFTIGNAPEPNEQNVLFGASQTGTTINGATNQSSTPVRVTSSQTLTTGGIGQAFVQPVSGVFTNFAVTLPGSTFTDIIFNPQIGGQPNAAGGPATVSVTASDGTFNFNYTLGNGQNYLTIVASAGETFSSVSFSAPGGFNQLQQIRISGVAGTGPGPTPTPAPEPMAMALFGLGLAGLGLVRRARAAG